MSCNCSGLQKLSIKIKTVKKGKIPKYTTENSAGADCFSNVDYNLYPNKIAMIPLGFKVVIPEGYEIQLRARSGLSKNHGITLINGVGTIDGDYSDEVCALIVNHSDKTFKIEKGMRVCQMVVNKYVKAEFCTVSKVNKTERIGGFGSTGLM